MDRENGLRIKGGGGCDPHGRLCTEAIPYKQEGIGFSPRRPDNTCCIRGVDSARGTRN